MLKQLKLDEKFGRWRNPGSDLAACQGQHRGMDDPAGKNRAGFGNFLWIKAGHARNASNRSRLASIAAVNWQLAHSDIPDNTETLMRCS